jgi:hypothetical protein
MSESPEPVTTALPDAGYRPRYQVHFSADLGTALRRRDLADDGCWPPVREVGARPLGDLSYDRRVSDQQVAPALQQQPGARHGGINSMQDSDYPHRQVWLEWVNRGAELGFVLGDFDWRKPAEHSRLGRRLVVDLIVDESYDAFLLGWYGPEGALQSVVLEDDEAGVSVLLSGA